MGEQFDYNDSGEKYETRNCQICKYFIVQIAHYIDRQPHSHTIVVFGMTKAMSRVLTDLQWCIRHHASVEKSAGLDKFGLSVGPQFDSGPKPFNSNQSIWILMRLRRWSRLIDTLHLRRSYRRRNTWPHLQLSLRHSFLRLLQLLPSFYFGICFPKLRLTARKQEIQILLPTRQSTAAARKRCRSSRTRT